MRIPPRTHIPPRMLIPPKSSTPTTDRAGRMNRSFPWRMTSIGPRTWTILTCGRRSLIPTASSSPATRKPNFAVSVAVNVVRVIVLLIVLAGLAGVGAVLGIAKGYVETAPTLNLAALDDQAQTSFIYDANNHLITEYKGIENRVSVSLAAMPKYLQDAFIAVEDARFYTHNGVDLKRIVGAFVSNLTSSSTQGGSTITQQLIKNTILSNEQSYKRKIQEAYLALQLETKYSKDQILESYLNTIYLG